MRYQSAIGLLGVVLSAGCDLGGRPGGLPHPDRLSFDREPGRTYFCDLPAPDVSRAGLVKGFCIREFATVGAPRVLAMAPEGGRVFVASPSRVTPGGAPAGPGAILILQDANGDGVADPAVTFLGGLATVHGLLFANNSLYYTVAEAVFRVPYLPGMERPMAPPERVADLTPQSPAIRWTHTLVQARDGTIFVSVGNYSSFTCPPNPREGAIFRLRTGSLEPELVSSGLRNPMYLRCNPSGSTCYAAELSDDGWDPRTGTEGREKLVVLRTGEDYGYPCCAGRGALAPPGRASGRAECGRVNQELRSWPLHDTPFGMDFERGTWPAPWRGGFFVGLHGAYGSWENTKLQWSPVDPTTGEPTGQWQDFATGWGRDARGLVGRVTDALFSPDGRLFFTDDQAGKVYWIAHETQTVP
jgi:glucose/arabinose dehydrogenase